MYIPSPQIRQNSLFELRSCIISLSIEWRSEVELLRRSEVELRGRSELLVLLFSLLESSIIDISSRCFFNISSRCFLILEKVGEYIVECSDLNEGPGSEVCASKLVSSLFRDVSREVNSIAGLAI